MFVIEVPEDELLKKIETPLMHDFVKISLKEDPQKFCIMPQHFVDNYLERIKNMEIFEDDVWVVTFPKCGTTWTQEMSWMIGHNLDYKTSLETKLDERFPFIEYVESVLTRQSSKLTQILCGELDLTSYKIRVNFEFFYFQLT